MGTQVKGRNEPANITRVADRVAESVANLMKVDLKELTEKCFKNTLACLNINK